LRSACGIWSGVLVVTRIRVLLLLGATVPWFTYVGHGSAATELNDYPTVARADYVFACMKTNGDTRQALEKCSCSIDVIASLLPYARYVDAETVLSLAQVPGVFGSMFRNSEQAKSAANDLRRAQAEAEVRCY
jgi:hypothetical protein